MSFTIFGLPLVSAPLSEYLFNCVLTCALVNLTTSPAYDKLKGLWSGRMIGKNHDINRAMETAFEMGLKDIFKPYPLPLVPETADEIRAKTCYDTLLKNRGKILFGENEDALNDEKIRNLLVPEKTEEMTPQKIRDIRARANENFRALVAPYIADAPDDLKTALETKLPDKTVFYFRELFKNDEKVFAAITVDGISDLKIEMARLQEMVAELSLPEAGADTRLILDSIVSFSELWIASDDKLDRLIADLGAWKAEIACKLDRIAAGIDTVDGKMDDLSVKFEELQHAAPEQFETIRRQIERLQQAMIQEGRNRQTSRRKSVGKIMAEKLFVDREAYLNRLAEFAGDDTVSLILVTGQGGIGKTALAARFCEGIEKAGYRLLVPKLQLGNERKTELGNERKTELGNERKTELGNEGKTELGNEGKPVHALVYVSKAEMQSFSADRLFEKLLQILEPEDIQRLEPILKDPQAGMGLKTERFLDALKHDAALLVLDNFEAVLDETAIRYEDLEIFLQTVCRTAHGLKVLITSRNDVSLDAAGVMKRMGLNDGLDPDHAAEFLRKLGADIRQIQEADDAQLKRLAEKVFGVPMALRSLASFLSDRAGRRIPIDTLLNDESRFADFKKHDYQNGLRKLIQEQYASLPDDARLALQVLAVFHVPVKPVAVQYILPNLDAEAVLDMLALDFFLAQANQDEFELHPSVQEFAYEQIPLSSKEENSGFFQSLFQKLRKPFLNRSGMFTRTALHTRAADFFAQLKKPKSEWKSLPDLQPHLDEFHQRVKAGQYERAADLLTDIDFKYLLTWGHLQLMADLHESLQGKLNDPDLKERSTGNLGTAYSNMGQVHKAIHCYEQALEIARETKSRDGEAAWLGNLGLCYRALGDTARAAEYHEKALAIHREIGYRQGEATTLGNLGICYYALGDTARAAEYHEKALAIDREIGFRRGEATHLGNLGLCYADLGDTARAAEYLEQTLAIDREIGYRQGEASTLGNLGICYRVLGDTARAAEYHEKALAIHREIGYRQGEATQLGNLGNCYSDLGDTARAAEYHEKALAIHREIGYRRGEATHLGNLGNCYYALGDTARAAEYHEKSLAIKREIGYRQGEAISLGNLGCCYYALGDTARAAEYYEKALAIDREIGYRQGEALDFINLGDALAALEKWDEAISNYQQAIQTADEIANVQGQNEARYGLATAYLCTGKLPQARTVIEQALQYDYPETMHNVHTLHGIMALRLQDPDTAKQAFDKAVIHADTLLRHASKNYAALDAKALSLCGLALCENDPRHIQEAVKAYQAAREITQARGIVNRFMRLFDELLNHRLNGLHGLHGFLLKDLEDFRKRNKIKPSD
jgi:tetratricopeptide (TPR) repeat protein